MPSAVSINYLAVLVAAIANMAFGFLWYGALFGKQWMKLMGFDKKKMGSMKKGMGQEYAIGFAGTLIMSYVLAHFIDYMGATTAIQGAIVGFWLWLGFVATVTLGSVLWEGRPAKLYILNNLHNLIGIVIAGIILAIWM